MGCTEEGCFEIFKFQFSILVDFVELSISEEAMLFQLSTNKGQCQRSSINRHISLFKQEWDTTDVVFVTVSNKNPFDTVDILYNIGVIRDNIVNP